MVLQRMQGRSRVTVLQQLLARLLLLGQQQAQRRELELDLPQHSPAGLVVEAATHPEWKSLAHAQRGHWVWSALVPKAGLQSAGMHRLWGRGDGVGCGLA